MQQTSRELDWPAAILRLDLTENFWQSAKIQVCHSHTHQEFLGPPLVVIKEDGPQSHLQERQIQLQLDIKASHLEMGAMFL